MKIFLNNYFTYLSTLFILTVGTEGLSLPKTIDGLEDTFPRVKSLIEEISKNLAKPTLKLNGQKICMPQGDNPLLFNFNCAILEKALDDIKDVCIDIEGEDVDYEDLITLREQEGILESLSKNTDEFKNTVYYGRYNDLAQTVIKYIDRMPFVLEKIRGRYNAMLIVGICFGVIGGLIVIIVLILTFKKIRKNKKTKTNQHQLQPFGTNVTPNAVPIASTSSVQLHPAQYNNQGYVPYSYTNGVQQSPQKS